MAVRLLLPLLLVLALAPSWASAQPLPPQTQPPDAAADQLKAEPTSALLRETFESQFSKDQLAAFEGRPTLGQLIEKMSPDQRQGARARLGELERDAKTPEDFEQIARGYLMLDEHEPNAGQSAVRVAEAIQQLEPEKSTGFTLAAHGLHQMGDYPAATEWAKKALERDPNDKTAQAVYMLSVGRSRRSGSGMKGVAANPEPSSDNGTFAAPEWVVPEKDVAPAALSLMRQAVVARRGGDFERTRQLAQAAMNADPTASGVQKFFNLVDADYRKHADTTEYLRLSKEALDAGRGAEAVEWARKAAERSQHPTVYKILELTKQNAERLVQSADKPGPTKTPANSGVPLWPVGAGLGLLGIGYGVYRGSKQTYTSEDGMNPSPEVSPEQMRANHLKAAAVAGTLLVALAAWELGPGALAAARTLLATTGPAASGMTPAFAGAGAAGGGAAAGSGAVVVDQTLVVAGAKAAATTAVVAGGAKVLSDLYSNATPTGQNQGPGTQTQRPSSSLRKPGPVKDPKLQNIINDLFRGSDTTPGGTAGAVRNEIMTGRPTGNLNPKWHLEKADIYVRGLDNVLKQPSLDPVDRATAEALRADLLDALNNTRPVIVP